MKLTFNLFKIDDNWVMDSQKYFNGNFVPMKEFLDELSHGSKWMTLRLTTKEPPFYKHKFAIVKDCKLHNQKVILKGIYVDLSNNEDNIANIPYAYIKLNEDTKIHKYLENINSLYLVTTDVAYQHHVQ